MLLVHPSRNITLRGKRRSLAVNILHMDGMGNLGCRGVPSMLLKNTTLGPPCQLRPACCANSGRPEKDLPNGSGYQHEHAQKGRKGYFNTRKNLIFQASIFRDKNSEFQGKFQPKQPKLLHLLRKSFEKKNAKKKLEETFLETLFETQSFFDIHMNDIPWPRICRFFGEGFSVKNPRHHLPSVWGFRGPKDSPQCVWQINGCPFGR